MAHQNLAQLPPRPRRRDLRQRPLPGHLHRQPRRRPRPRTPHPPQPGRARPSPSRRLSGRRPPRHPRRGNPRVHLPHPSPCRPPSPAAPG
jgi:hypothetical protein